MNAHYSRRAQVGFDRGRVNTFGAYNRVYECPRRHAIIKPSAAQEAVRGYFALSPAVYFPAAIPPAIALISVSDSSCELALGGSVK
jgi:hypothetical protein